MKARATAIALVAMFALALGGAGEAAAAPRAKPHAGAKGAAKKSKATHAKAHARPKQVRTPQARKHKAVHATPLPEQEPAPRAARMACRVNGKVYLLADCSNPQLPTAPLAAHAAGQQVAAR